MDVPDTDDTEAAGGMGEKCSIQNVLVWRYSLVSYQVRIESDGCRNLMLGIAGSLET